MYHIEINKLEKGLIARGIDYIRRELIDGYQIIVGMKDNCGGWEWDAVCHSYSYGHQEGLLEVMGNISAYEDDVEGWLTAEEILNRLDERK